MQARAVLKLPENMPAKVHLFMHKTEWIYTDKVKVIASQMGNFLKWYLCK